MKVCPVCQTRYDEASSFCRKDGAVLVPDRAVAPEVLARRELLERRLAETPESPSLFEELGDLLASIPLHDEALVQLFKALELEPARESARRKVADVYRARAEWPQAARQLEALAESRPADPELLAALADVYEKAGRKSEAADVVGRLAGLAPGDPKVWAHWRDLLLETRRDPLLAPVYRRLTELEPAELRHWNDLASRLLADDEGSAEEWSRLEQRFAKGVEGGEAPAGNKGAWARLYLVVARLRLGTATPDTRRLLAGVEPHALPAPGASLASECLADLGELALGQGAEGDAFDAFTQGLRYQPLQRVRTGLARIHGERAKELLAAKRFREAVEECDRGLGHVAGEAGLVATRTQASSKRRLRFAAALGGGLVLVVGVATWVVFSGGRRFLGERPTPADLVASYAKWAREQEGVKEFRQEDDGRTLAFRIGDDAWKIAVDRPAVTPLDDDTGARGTLETRWEKNGAAVGSRKGLPPAFQKLSGGAKAAEARYVRSKKRWKW